MSALQQLFLSSFKSETLTNPSTYSLVYSTSISARYWRIKDIVIPGGGYLEISELEFLTDNIKNNSNKTYTSSEAPIGGGGGLNDIFDGNTGTRNYWTESTVEQSSFWIKVSYDEAQKINGIRQAGFDTITRYMSGFTVEYSLDDITWTPLKTFSNLFYPGNQIYSTPYTFNDLDYSGVTGYDNTSLLLNFDIAPTTTSFNDLSKNFLSLTKTGSVVISDTQSISGNSSAYFDSNSGSIQISTSNTTISDLFNFRTGDFTAEARIYPEKLNVVILDRYVGTGGWQVYINSSGKVEWYSGGTALITSNATISINNWYHLAIVRSGTTTSLYINGIFDKSAISSYDYNTNATVAIGAQIWVRNATYDYQGYIDDVRIVKGTALYTSNFTPEPFNFVVTGAIVLTENSTNTFTVNTTNVSDSTTLYWTINHGTTDNSDFSATSGSFVINSNTGTFDIIITDDATTEGNETFTIEIRTGSTSGTIVATSSTITIEDTSLDPPTYTISIDPYFDNVSVLLNFEGANGSTTITDSSSNNLTVSAFGSAQISTAQSVFSNTSSLKAFRSTSDYITIPHSSLFEFGTGDFTIECWVYPTFLNSSRPRILGSYNYFNGNLGGAFSLEIDGSSGGGSNKVRFQHRLDPSAELLSTTALQTNQWYHIAVSKQGTTLRLAINGIIEDTSTTSIAFSTNTANAPFYIGAGPYNPVEYFYTGYIDNVRITKGIARFTTNFSVPTYLYPTLSNSLTEASTTTYTVNTTLVSDSTTLYWTINHGTTDNSDFSATSGSFVINSNTGTFDITTTDDITTEGDETFTIEIRTGSTSGTVVATSDTITIQDTSLTPPATYAIPSTGISARYWRFKDIVIPGSGGGYLELYELELLTDGVKNTSSKTVDSSVSPFFGTISDAFDGDIDSRCIWYEADVETASFWIKASFNDPQIINGIRQACDTNRYMSGFTIEYSTDDTNWTSLETFSDLIDSGTKNFSSIYEFNPVLNNFNISEASTVTYTVITTYVSDSTTLYWTINHGTTDSNDFSVTSGSFVINSNTGTFDITTTDDATTEGDETFTIEIRTGSTSGTVVATSDTITIQDTSLTRTYTISVDPYFDNVSLLLDMDGTSDQNIFVDKSINQLTVTANGDVITSNQNVKFGSTSLKTAISGASYIEVADTPLLRMENEDFTIEGWFIPLVSGNDRFFYMQGINTPGGLALSVGTGGVLFRADGQTNLIYNTVISNSVFTHIAFVRENTTRRIFINGTLVASDNLSFNNNDQTTLHIGASSKIASDTFRYYGYIDDLRITKGTARYTSNFSVPTTSFTTLPALTENSTITYTVITTNVSDSTTLYWTINHGTTDNSDFSVTSGSFVINSNTGTFDITTTDDATTEGNETFTIEIRTGSTSGTVVATSDTITIQDTSLTRTYTISVDPDFDNVSLLLDMDGSNGSTTFTDSSNNNLVITANGNAQISTTQSKFGGSSAYFDGNGDYLDVEADPYFNFGTGDFTVEFWIWSSNAPTTSPYRRIIAHPSSTNAAGTFQIWHVSSTTGNSVADAVELAFSDGTNIVVSTKTAISDSTWHHIAFTRASGTSMAFLDGVLKNTAQDSNNYIRGESEGIRIGNRGDLNPTSFLNGYIDDLRITKGVARYTSNFSVPTTSFTTLSALTENSTVTYIVNTTNVSDSTTLYWTINHGTTDSNDFSVTSGSFVINSNTGTFDITTTDDATTEGNETFTIEIRTGSTSGTVVATSDTITIQDTSLTRTYTIEVDPDFDKVALLLQFDGSNGSTTFTDSSLNPKTVTPTTWTISTAQSKFGGSAAGSLSSGNTSRIEITPTAELQMGSSNFTFEGWFYPTSNASQQSLFQFNAFTGFIHDTISFRIVSSTWVIAEVGSLTISNTSFTFPINQWSHVAITRSGSTIRVFVNGTQVGSGNYSGTLPTQDRMWIGNSSRSGSSALPFSGYIDEFRITKGVARYTSNFSVPTTSFTTLPALTENSTVTYTVNTTNVSDSTTLYWTINHGTTDNSDFSATSGSFVINSNTGTFDITTTDDATTEGNETFTIEIRTGSTSGTVVATSSTITIQDTSLTPPPTYTILETGLNITENSTVTYTVNTTNVSDSTTLYWTINHGTTDNSDFSATSGSFVINSNTGTFDITTTDDATTEGDETFTIEIRTGSTSGTIVDTSSTITIQDTSLTPSSNGLSFNLAASYTPPTNEINIILD